MYCVVVGKNGKFYAVPSELARKWYDCEMTVADAEEITDVRQIYEKMYGALGVFALDSWGIRHSNRPDIPKTNSYDFSCCGGVTMDVMRRILQTADAIPAFGRGVESSSVQVIFLPLDIQREKHAVVCHDSKSEKPNNIDLPGIKSNAIGVQYEAEYFCMEPEYLWVMLDGPVGQALKDENSGTWVVLIPEYLRHYFFKVKFRLE